MTSPPAYTKRTREGVEVYAVDPPDQIREKLIPLNSDGAKAMEQRFRQRPARASLNRWRTDGYPIDRNGPRVILPSITTLKRVHTSQAALHRFFRMIQYLGEQISEAGGVKKWREASYGR